MLVSPIVNCAVGRQKVEIPKAEYNLLKEAYNQIKRQVLLCRIMEAEENLKKKKVKKISANEFIENV